MSDGELVPRQRPCSCDRCYGWEPLGCPAVSDDNAWGKGKCDAFEGCACDGIRQGILSEFACEACYLEQK